MKLKRFLSSLSILCGLALVIGCAPQQFVTLKDLLSTQPIPGVTEPQEAESTVCKGLEYCVEGWVSKEAEFLRFSTTEAADRYVTTLGDRGFMSNFLVIDWTGEVSPADRLGTEQVFEGAHQSQ